MFSVCLFSWCKCKKACVFGWIDAAFRAQACPRLPLTVTCSFGASLSLSLMRCSTNPGGRLMTVPWANYAYSQLSCLSVRMSVTPILSPSLSVEFRPIPACTSIEMRRWPCFGLLLCCCYLAVPTRLTQTEQWSKPSDFYLFFIFMQACVGFCVCVCVRACLCVGR